MFREVMKLRSAKRALAEGRFEDAFKLADEKDIREHLKAAEVRRRAILELRARAESREKSGDFEGAVADWRFVAASDPSADVGRRVESLRKAKTERVDTEARVRAGYFKARLEVERGDIRGALDILGCIPAADRTREAVELMLELEGRLTAAAALVREAADAVKRSGSDAIEKLDRAALLDPRHPDLKSIRVQAMAERAATARTDDADDERLLAYLVEHGIEKRRHFVDASPDALIEIERTLNAEVARRLERRLGDGDVDALRRLLDRRRESLMPDRRLDAVSAALARLDLAKECVRRGRFDEARVALAEVAGFFGDAKGMDREIARVRSVIDEMPAIVAEADAAMRRGELDRARRRWLEVVEKLPAFREAARSLAVVEKRIAAEEGLLARAKDAVARGRFEVARDILVELDAMNCRMPEAERLRDEIRVREGAHPLFPKSDGARTSRSSHPTGVFAGRGGGAAIAEAGSATDEFGSAWMLAVEECGEYAVFEKDAVVIGNAIKRAADLCVMGSLASRHAVITRTFSFHGGVKYSIEALDGHPLEIDGKPVTKAALEKGATVRLGRDFTFRFLLPAERSRAASLELARGFEFEGTTHVILMPPSGRNGAVIVGDDPEAHVKIGGRGRCEVHREKEGDRQVLFCRGPEGVHYDGGPATPKLEVTSRKTLISGDLRLNFRSI